MFEQAFIYHSYSSTFDTSCVDSEAREPVSRPGDEKRMNYGEYLQVWVLVV